MKFLLLLVALFTSTVVTAGADDGEALLDRLRAQVDSQPVEARKLLVDELCQQKLYKEAAQHYRWLWENEVEPDHNPVRTKIFWEQLPLGVLVELETYLEGAKSRYFLAARSEQPDPTDVATWVVFEMEFGDPEVVINWYQGLADPYSSTYELARPWAFQVMVEKEMWTEAGSVFPDPSAYAIHLMGVWDFIDEADSSLRKTTDQWALTTFGNLYRALLAASRTEDANSLKEVVLKRRATDELRQTFLEIDSHRQ